MQTLEGDLENEPEVRTRAQLGDGAEAFDRVVANEFVEALQLLVSEAEIGLAHRGQRAIAILVLAPDAERIIGIEAGALAVTALRIHQDGIDEMGIPLPLEPRPLWTAGLVNRGAPLE